MYSIKADEKFYKDIKKPPVQAPGAVSADGKKDWNSAYLALISSFFFTNYERTLSADFQFAPMDLARATLVLIRVLRTLINSIAKNLHKLQICLRFYSFYNKLDIQPI